MHDKRFPSRFQLEFSASMQKAFTQYNKDETSVYQ